MELEEGHRGTTKMIKVMKQLLRRDQKGFGEEEAGTVKAVDEVNAEWLFTISQTLELGGA